MLLWYFLLEYKLFFVGRLEPGSHAIEFEFANLVKEHESYYGRYGEREKEKNRKINKRQMSNVVNEHESCYGRRERGKKLNTRKSQMW